MIKRISYQRKNHCSSYYILIIFLIISCSIIDFSTTRAEKNGGGGGFSIELIHRDSPIFKNPNFDFVDQIESSGLVHDSGTYLMKLWYGTPPFEVLQLLDTGSDFPWIQCSPCVHCYSSRYQPFNPNTSRTFKWERCHRSNRTCPYSTKYDCNSTSKGLVARDTITVGIHPHKITQIENFLFGCGHENRGYYPQKSAGIVGFSPKEKSFITQLSRRHQGKFSLCLTAPSSLQPGRVSFGHEAIVSGPDVMTTPLIIDRYYNVLLDSITVGTKKIKNYNYKAKDQLNYNKSNNDGKMVVDSGTNVMFLSTYVYHKIEKKIKKQIKEKPVPSPDKILKLCYSRNLRDYEIPNITVHLHGADLHLSPLNTFIRAHNIRCLAMAPTDSGPIFGNMAMTNFLVGFDLVEKKIFFKPTNCSRLQ